MTHSQCCDNLQIGFYTVSHHIFICFECACMTVKQLYHITTCQYLVAEMLHSLHNQSLSDVFLFSVCDAFHIEHVMHQCVWSTSKAYETLMCCQSLSGDSYAAIHWQEFFMKLCRIIIKKFIHIKFTHFRTMLWHKLQGLSHGPGYQQDVGEYDGSIQVVSAHGLQSDLHHRLHIQHLVHECHIIEKSIFRQISASLSHEPYWFWLCDLSL